MTVSQRIEQRHTEEENEHGQAWTHDASWTGDVPYSTSPA